MLAAVIRDQSVGFPLFLVGLLFGLISLLVLGYCLLRLWAWFDGRRGRAVR